MLLLYHLVTHILPLSLFLDAALGHRVHRRDSAAAANGPQSESVAITNGQAIMTSTVPAAPLATLSIGKVAVLANTTAATAPKAELVAVDAVDTVSSKVLIIARDTVSAYSAWSGLNDRGIPYETLIVPAAGVALPALNSSETQGNYGLIVVMSEVSYSYTGLGYQSALTADQWQALYNYQVSFRVRMVRLDSYPSAAFGTQALGACCGDGVEQLVHISDNSAFPKAGLRTGATMSTKGIYHYPTQIINSTLAKEFLQLGASSDGQFTTASTAGVINNIDGREQMVFYVPFSTDWAVTSVWLQHAWIDWGTRGLYTGYRRALLPTQIDDMFLESDIYSPTGTTYRIGTDDLAQHITFMRTINSKLNAGSNWFIEVGHNGNGNIEKSDELNNGGKTCSPGPIEYGEQIDTPLEWVKPLGTGTNIWPSTAGLYPNYSSTCMDKDPLLQWWTTPSNLNAYAHVSHTFTHEDQNNATYSDVYKEITWNQAWLAATGIANAEKFASTGLIPPAITGLHNGDALRAWSDNGITHVVGDNTRPALLNPNNEHWPLFTTVAANGFAGIQITPRWATNIYYNCDTPACTVLEWINTSAGSGDINTLLEIEKQTNVRHLLGLHHDAFIRFHQANLRYNGGATYTINGVTAKLSLFMAWVETVTQEFVRLVDWPLISYKHDDLAAVFLNRMTRDACGASLSYQLDITSSSITGFTLFANGDTCSTPIPVTLPGPVTDTQGATVEQIGSDPTTLWVTLSGSPVSFTLSTPLPIV
ncbi:hypothetical protein SS1G_04473 [Sclerotinia sclerotiorum 1980 UF-70]|uniref:Extracellular serine-rich protein n=1 Tax=Sclerotinia sclerotiorum (strain ATCC 18683 / 1980 / Ss-1) TaxID=665079 RepID=A7EGN1_SCLS1|nr:hypothetical protein SS1G_04473 [Sclerotinia sclerotiorum 1980 UF-70]EDO01997.1 hypothetical protein SS1G_04473 [Sclerotinia sclerotiorum 1980 UF-70]